MMDKELWAKLEELADLLNLDAHEASVYTPAFLGRVISEIWSLKEQVNDLEAWVVNLRSHLRNALIWEEARVYINDDGSMWVDKEDEGIVMPLASAAGLDCFKIEKRKRPAEWVPKGE